MTIPLPKKPLNIVAIGVGVLCFILLMALVAIYFDYSSIVTSKNNQISTLQTELNGNVTALATANSQIASDQTQINAVNAQITTLQTELSGNVTALATANSQITTLDATISSDNTQIATLTSQLATANAIITLSDSTVWVNDQTYTQPAGSYSTVTFSASYAGYVNVYIQSSSVAGTWVEVIYSSNGVNYDQAYTGSQAINVGNSIEFPILPSSSITIGIGNGNIFGSATEVATITYNY
jgi:hypothetical protein